MPAGNYHELLGRIESVERSLSSQRRSRDNWQGEIVSLPPVEANRVPVIQPTPKGPTTVNIVPELREVPGRAATRQEGRSEYVDDISANVNKLVPQSREGLKPPKSQSTQRQFFESKTDQFPMDVRIREDRMRSELSNQFAGFNVEFSHSQTE